MFRSPISVSLLGKKSTRNAEQGRFRFLVMVKSNELNMARELSAS
jgi:hypothetical protein